MTKVKRAKLESERKDFKKLRDLPRFREVAVRNTAVLYKAGDKVEIEWGWNQAVKDDQVFKIKIGREEAIIDYQELMHYGRAFKGEFTGQNKIFGL